MKETNLIPHTMEVTYFNVLCSNPRLVWVQQIQEVAWAGCVQVLRANFNNYPLGNTEIILYELGAQASSQRQL